MIAIEAGQNEPRHELRKIFIKYLQKPTNSNNMQQQIYKIL